ncbi:MAG TPA: hypothetical protein VER96_25685 [Polyangiaceae bacterium]|nr:hypothetical protein [Polyangiaceae bacterium]
MSEQANIAKAQLIEINLSNGQSKSDGRTTSVQFNPEALKVTFANQIVPPPGGSDQNGSAAMQFVGAGTTKLSLTVWFDVTALEDGENTKNDVRQLTEGIAYFITPKKNDATPPTFLPPGVRFLWGTFQFDGLMDSMEENLDYFSNDGRPLRASVAFTLSQQKIQFQRANNASGGRRPAAAFGSLPGLSAGGGGGAAAGVEIAAGTNPFTPAPSGSSLQALANAGGVGDRWQEVAAANGVLNPRMMLPGQLIDLNATLEIK